MINDHGTPVKTKKKKYNDIFLRKIRESFWIDKLNTIHPHGLNQNNGIGDGIKSSKN